MRFKNEQQQLLQSSGPHTSVHTFTSFPIKKHIDTSFPPRKPDFSLHVKDFHTDELKNYM